MDLKCLPNNNSESEGVHCCHSNGTLFRLRLFQKGDDFQVWVVSTVGRLFVENSLGSFIYQLTLKLPIVNTF